MTRKELPKSIRKHLRKKKACVRRETTDSKKRKKKIDDLYKKFLNKQTKNES
jgi:hypothetical protein